MHILFSSGRQPASPAPARRHARSGTGGGANADFHL